MSSCTRCHIGLPPGSAKYSRCERCKATLIKIAARNEDKKQQREERRELKSLMKQNDKQRLRDKFPTQESLEEMIKNEESFLNPNARFIKFLKEALCDAI